MAGRGAQTFKKRQKEQQRKEKQQEKFAKRLERKRLGPGDPSESDNLSDQEYQIERDLPGDDEDAAPSTPPQ